MKLQKSESLSAFGGINFVLEFIEQNNINALVESSFPELPNQSQYRWKDIINSLLSIYLCGGDCIEDIQSHLKDHFVKNPYIKMPSPDTVLRRLNELTVENNECQTKRGSVTHTYNDNNLINQFNVSFLKQQRVLDAKELTLDYDNTIIFNEKSDSKMTYKRNYGYQPGVCNINEEYVLYVEGRNGNSDAKSFQKDTLDRVFKLLENNRVKKVNHFRADAASYQYDVVKLLDQKVENFYIGCRNSYIAKYFTMVDKWDEMIDSTGEKMEVGEILIRPFQQQAQDEKEVAKEYRLIVKRKPRSDNQLDLFTLDSFDYRAILSNNTDFTTVEVAQFYNQRGNMERQFDILKNDFGWRKMPFSTMDSNTVFLGITAFIKNLYSVLIRHFSKFTKFLKPTDRVKKFLFRFIILPSKWIKRSRQISLRIFTSSDKYSALAINST